MPKLSELQRDERQAFSEVWSTLAAISRRGVRWPGLFEDPLSVLRHRDGTISFGFRGPTLMHPTRGKLLVVTEQATFSYRPDGVLQYAHLNDEALLPVERLLALAEERSPNAEWN